MTFTDFIMNIYFKRVDNKKENNTEQGRSKVTRQYLVF